MMTAAHRLAVAFIAAIVLCVSPAFAQDAKTPQNNFYRGKTVTLVISSSSGGGYDIMGRALARHLPRHIPGNPRVIVTNMPGAGGIVAMNYLYRAAPKDGTYIGGVQNNLPFEPLLGTKEAIYDATKFNWLGSPSIEVGLIAVWKTVPVNSLDDLQEPRDQRGLIGRQFDAELLRAAAQRNAQDEDEDRRRLSRTERGLSRDGARRGRWLPEPLLQHAERDAAELARREEPQADPAIRAGEGACLPDVPSALDLVTNPEDKQLLQAGLAQVTMGRPYLMPPGVPEDRVAIMRKAFEDTLKDRAFLADARRLSLGVRNSRTGPQIQAVLEEAYKTPPNIVARLRTLSLH